MPAFDRRKLGKLLLQDRGLPAMAAAALLALTGWTLLSDPAQERCRAQQFEMLRSAHYGSVSTDRAEYAAARLCERNANRAFDPLTTGNRTSAGVSLSKLAPMR